CEPVIKCAGSFECLSLCQYKPTLQLRSQCFGPSHCLGVGVGCWWGVPYSLTAGERLLASLPPPPPPGSSSSPLSPPLSLVTQKQPVVKEEPLYPAALCSDIQLLPQQAGMAAILATAVVNKDIFPCKDCGIWYRSERNLQAHLMYYCASRQKQPAAASSPPQDKPKESYPNERICPFPQCNKSCPSASSLEIHMRTHSGERPFVCLICLSAFTTKANCERHLKVHTDTLNGLCHGCGFVSTTRDILYSHLVTSHMVCQPGSRSEVYSPGPGLPKLPLSTASAACTNPPRSQGSSGKEPHPSPNYPGAPCLKKTMETATSTKQTSDSPKSPSTTTVKAEPTSPTPGSSPAHVGGTESVLPGGAMFLPQYMFNTEAAILPQASEILAKMSEMVHSRLKQAAATPPHKGATCFECDITFNNINNFYAHKRLYCSSRHQVEGATSASGPRDTAPATGAFQWGTWTETPVGREGISSSSEGEGGGASAGGGGGGRRASEGSQSPASGSAEDLEDDPNRTFCEACNIRFSRHDNYTVHKRFYCASRHDPSNQRAVHMAKATTAAAFLPQPIRTRKRKKMYEIHMARTEALANAAAAAAAAATSAASAPSPSVLGLAVKQEVSPSAAGGSSPEGDGPIDLSKRPRLRDVPRHSSSSILPALPLTDYHKCTACSISFNSIENYLAHKTYYCPATTLQPHTLDSPQVVCPYCPNRPIACDLMEHFKSTHSLVVTIQQPQEALPHPSPGGGSPLTGSPLPVSSPRAPSLTVSPVPEVLRETVGSSHPPDKIAATVASNPIPTPQPAPTPSPKTTVIAPVQNGNSRFCRLCNIKFSSLSTFIAHKKYYCSSHSAEHVK
uniref:Zinc finger protein, FOG family member 1 n=1 Tax=Lates calcarifer TaxID=8187 RepID=A0A4W6F319_LATCA